MLSYVYFDVYYICILCILLSHWKHESKKGPEKTAVLLELRQFQPEVYYNEIHIIIARATINNYKNTGKQPR